MLYNRFNSVTLSRLGFGTMRLPLNEDKSIDEATSFEMIDYALSHGINYFDTAYPYHKGYSEIVVGKALSRYPREKYFLATKFPGHQVASTYDPKVIFEDQLKKCRVEYFDFYLLHNVNESNIDVYTNPKWGIIPYFVEQRKNGRIRHLGFSSHGSPDNLKTFLDIVGDTMEFCQIQLNFLDWTLQDAKQKYDILTERNIPIWVMEPVRGGKLSHLPDDVEAELHALRPDESIPAWSFRYLQSFPNIKMILSGMTSPDQLRDNIKTFSSEKPLNADEISTLYRIAERIKDAVPCTGCRYCCDNCSAELNIPFLMSLYNDMKFSVSLNVCGRMLSIDRQHWPDQCVRCGKCVHSCPQKIDIPSVFQDFSKRLLSAPDWALISQQRTEEAAEMRKKQNYN